MPRNDLWTAACLVAIVLSVGCTAPREPADLVLLNGKIVTLETDVTETQALAARDGIIVALGGDEEIRPYVGPDTRVIDLEGRLAVPGFIEGHGHFTGVGRSLMNLDLSATRSWEQIVEVVAAVAQETAEGQWIVGWGWHQEKWDAPPPERVEGYPTHDLLSRAVPHHPVLLKHAAGSHGGIVNAKAMELAGIGPDTPDPPGGKILRDARGRPTGVLREAAYGLALGAHNAWLQELTDEELEARALREIELADQECLSNGLTSFQDAGSDFDTVDRLRALADAGRLGVRLWVMLRSDNDELERRIDDYRIDGAGDDHLTVRALKRSIDGALGTHGAWLLAPYSDLPDTSGLNTAPLDDLERTARIALEHGFQLAVHAIGDRGNRETLDIFERVFGEAGGGELRWRIEHAQHLDPEDIPRFAELGVVASMQGVHCTSDGPWVPLRLGDERAEQGAYVWRELLESGAVVSNGTDAPVENVDPIANFHSTVTRMMNTGQPFYPAQRMTREQALRSYTLNAAYAAFEEEIKGSLRPGKLADITVLSRDILTIPEASIPDTEVLYTIVGGRVLYER
jgi:predicted amidohydrolase YtcJ